MAKSPNNPYKANQHRPDPRQALFLANYIDPKSATFSNAVKSAIAAGYSEEYGLALFSHMPTWLSESLNDLDVISQAEKNLKRFLSDGYDKSENIKADMTKFTLERLKKEKYAARTEQTNPEKDAMVAEIKDEVENLFKEYVSKKEDGKAGGGKGGSK